MGGLEHLSKGRSRDRHQPGGVATVIGDNSAIAIWRSQLGDAIASVVPAAMCRSAAQGASRLHSKDADMNSKLYSDQDLEDLRRMPKRVTNPGARWSEKPGHKQRNLQAVGEQGHDANFVVYLSQNLRDERDFSCGIAYIPKGGRRLTLARYNGPSHRHGVIAYRPHVHRATAAAIADGRKPESQATETDRFETLDGALKCLIDDFVLRGVKVPQHEEGRLPL